MLNRVYRQIIGYQYEGRDKEIAPVRFYYDLIQDAENAGFEALIDWVEHLYAEHQSCQIVSNHVGVARGTISNWLTKSGYPKKGPGGYNGR